MSERHVVAAENTVVVRIGRQRKIEQFENLTETIPSHYRTTMIIRTWLERQSLAEVFCFAKTMAAHRFVDLDRTVILDISVTRRKDKLLGIYNAA